MYGRINAVAIRNLKNVRVMGGNSRKAIFPATKDPPQKAVVRAIKANVTSSPLPFPGMPWMMPS